MISIQHIINRLRNHPTGLTNPEAREAARLLEEFNRSHGNPNRETVIRSMSVAEAQRFDEFKAFQDNQKKGK